MPEKGTSPRGKVKEPVDHKTVKIPTKGTRQAVQRAKQALGEAYVTKLAEQLRETRHVVIPDVIQDVTEMLYQTYVILLDHMVDEGGVEAVDLSAGHLKIIEHEGRKTIQITKREEIEEKTVERLTKQLDLFFETPHVWDSLAEFITSNLVVWALDKIDQEIEGKVEDLTLEEMMVWINKYIIRGADSPHNGRTLRLVETYFLKLAESIVQDILKAQTLNQLQFETLLGLRDGMATKIPPLKTNPDLFGLGNIAPFSSSLVPWEVANILSRKKDLPWATDHNGALAYTREFKDPKNRKGAVYFWVTEDGLGSTYPELLAGEAALATIDAFDVRAACMQIIFSSYAMACKRPWEEEFVISDKQIESYLGLNKRKDLSKSQKLELIEKIALQTAQIVVYVGWPGADSTFTLERARNWDIAIRYHGQMTLDGAKGTGLTLRVRAGMWAKHFINREAAEGKEAFFQFGHVSKDILHTITSVWHNNGGAARLLIWLLFQTRVRLGQEFKVPHLMDVAYGKDRVRNAQADFRERNNLATMWDNDLLVLQTKGWKIEFDPETYPPEIRPDWADRPGNTRPNKYWDAMQLARLTIYPPDEVTQKLSDFEQRKKGLPSPKKPPEKGLITKEQIKEARERKGLSQRELGMAMGKSQTWVNFIESGTRSVSAADLPKLKTILDL